MMQEAAPPHLLGQEGRGGEGRQGPRGERPGQGCGKGPPSPHTHRPSPCGCLCLLILVLAGVQPVGLLQREGSGHDSGRKPGFFRIFREASVGPQALRMGPRLLCPPRQAPGSAYLPGETLLLLPQVSLQHRLQLLLQDAEGLPRGQAQGQGGLALQGSQKRSAWPRRPPPSQAPPPSSRILPSSSTSPPSGCKHVPISTKLKDSQVHRLLLFKAKFKTKLPILSAFWPTFHLTFTPLPPALPAHQMLSLLISPSTLPLPLQIPFYQGVGWGEAGRDTIREILALHCS